MGSFENRAHYREVLPPGILSIAILPDRAKYPIPTQIADISFGGTGLVVPNEFGRRLSVDQQFWLELSSPKVPSLLVKARARVAHISQRPSGSFQVGFAFLKASAIAQALPPELAIWLNRRKAYRVPPVQNDVIPITIEPVSGDASGVSQGTLADVGTLGIAAFVDFANVKVCGTEGSRKLILTLDTDPEPVVVVCAFRYRTTYESKFRIGFRFDGDATADWKRHERVIAQYSTKRQGDIRAPK